MSWANHAKLYVDIFKNSTITDLKYFNTTLVLWFYCAECRSKIINDTFHDNYHLNGQTPHTLMDGQPTDISDICEFRWYWWCYYWYPADKLPNNVECLSRVLGPAYHTSIAMYQSVTNQDVTALPK